MNKNFTPDNVLVFISLHNSGSFSDAYLLRNIFEIEDPEAMLEEIKKEQAAKYPEIVMSKLKEVFNKGGE